MKIVNEKEFESEIKKGLVLVDFFATWCGPCRMMGGILEEIDEELSKKAKIIKVNVDDCEKVARKFGIMSIPTIILFKDGKEVEKHIGLMQRDDLIKWVEKY